METVYPDVKEIKFRKKKYGVIGDILNDKIQCGICNNDLLNEIISKKMIMVHKSHLILCCHNCFFKLCEGNEFSCILCKSNIELSNCEKCILNICKRCVINHNIKQVSNGILSKCFGCVPQMLWNLRAQAANVLIIFYSQLDMPNGLLVNEIEREQTVRKYLLKEAKIGQNSATDSIKDHLCMDFILNSYKTTVIDKLLNFSPNINNSIPTDECSKQFIQICENVLEKTCSALTDFKRIFNINSQLNPGVSAIMKSLLKTVDEDEITVNESRTNGDLKNSVATNNFDQSLKNTGMSENEENSKKKLNNTKTYQSSSMCSTRSSRSESKDNCDVNILEPTTSSSNVNVQSIMKNKNKELVVVIERCDNSVISKQFGKESDITNLEINEIDHHPLEFFGDLSSDEETNTKELRNRKLIQNNKHVKKEQNKKLKKKPVSSEDEKEINRLTNLNNIKISKTKKVENDEDSNDTDGHSDNNLIMDIDEDINSTKSIKASKNKVDKTKLIEEVVENIDEISTDTENESCNDKCSLEVERDIFNEVRNAAMSMFQGISEASSDESDDTSLFDVFNEVLATCNQRGSEHYHNKHKANIKNTDIAVESDEENGTSEEQSLFERNSEVIQRKLSPLNLPSVSDDSDVDLKAEKNTKGEKRKIISSNSSSNSDSSSKYFKQTPMKRNRSNNKKNSFSDVSHSDDSNNSSDGNSSPIVTKKYRGRHKKLSSSNESSDENEDSDGSKKSTAKKRRKNIRRLKKKTELSQLTLSAIKDEESRKKRIEERQKLYNKMFDLPKVIGTCEKLVLDFDPKTKQELVTVHPDVVKFLKPHQVEGVKFLWNSVFESLAQIKKSKGSGSIVAHCMGLGKTLQVIALVHTLFRYPETGIKTVLIITPHATIENWCKEFHKWLDDIPENKHFLILNFTDSKTYAARNKLIKEWQEEHGVLITSYNMYRRIVTDKSTKKFPNILKGLADPGPDLIICDEGHLLKNHNSATSKAVNGIKTLRRIVLTGTPLQNNLKEYHCMVDFIRPNLLGSLKDFTNRFVNPISNGQYSDSTPHDVKLMKRRSHVLHRMLEGFVQRFDYSVLTPFLPPKHEYVIYLRISDKQIELYRHYLDNCRQPELFTNYNMLQMIWTHPKLLKVYSERMENKREKQKNKELDAALINDSTSCSDSGSNSIEEIENEPIPESTRDKSPEIDLNWWKPLVSKKDLENIYPYSKFIMMFSILQECEEIGDKVLLFSQSLYTLDLIQHFLENAEDIADDKHGPYGNSWTEGQDYFRIDGSVNVKVREDCCDKFNDVNNTKIRLLLLSTKAFNLGINLVGANRVIIFDVTWNPSLNVQSIFRVFRFGQKKPCYIYRFISEGTMEQKIYERQISKLSLSFRVVDEHQIDRHFNAKDQEELYEFEPNTSEPKALNLPKDRLMAELILKHKDLVVDILEHDSLLQNNEAEELDESDRNAAWEDYEKERDGLNRRQENIQNMNIASNASSSMNNSIIYNPIARVETSQKDVDLFITLKRLFPHADMLQLNEMLNQVKQQQRQRV